MWTKTVLPVQALEDELTIYTTMLRHAGYRVLVASTGEQGLRLALAERPALILTALDLPVVDGWRMIEVLRGHPAGKDMPIVALTADARPESRDAARDTGVDGYLLKPVEPGRVVEEVRRRIGAPRPDRESGPRTR